MKKLKNTKERMKFFFTETSLKEKREKKGVQTRLLQKSFS